MADLKLYKKPLLFCIFMHKYLHIYKKVCIFALKTNKYTYQ